MRLTTRARTNGNHSDRSADHDEHDGAPSRWMKAGTVCAIGLSATLLACTVIVVTGRHRTDDSTPPPATYPTVQTAPTTDTTSTAATGGPGSTASSTTVAGAAPGDVTWQQVGLGALPFSASAGPRTVTGGVPSGFTHDQSGALLAASQILGRLSWAATTPAEMRAVAQQMTAPSAQAAAALTYGPPDDPALIPQLAGYQILTYTPQAAVINLALRFHATVRVVPAALAWTGGDWRLSGAPGPLAQSSWAAVDDLTGYVLFSGQPTTTGH